MIRLVLLAALGATACTPTLATRLAVSDAIDLCTTRAVVFGAGRYGPDADEPPDSVVQDRYRACVYANSGDYPNAPVAWRRPPPTPIRQAVDL